jgi:hypothetical protein
VLEAAAITTTDETLLISSKFNLQLLEATEVLVFSKSLYSRFASRSLIDCSSSAVWKMKVGPACSYTASSPRSECWAARVEALTGSQNSLTACLSKDGPSCNSVTLELKSASTGSGTWSSGSRASLTLRGLNSASNSD